MRAFAGAALAIVALVAAVRPGSDPACPSDFEVRIAAAPVNVPPVSGRCVMVDGKPVFQPSFPLMRGVTYSVRAGGREIDRLGAAVTPPARQAEAKVYPTSSLLPANQLKLYVEFSVPMMLGESHRRLRLLDADGNAIHKAFLSVDEEMWDAQRQRLTVLFDPGRVKRGLKANLEEGAPLMKGASYTLVVDGDWPDAHGAPMRAGTTKQFTVGAADRQLPAPDLWRLTAPAAGSRAALRLRFDEPMDYAVALNAIRIVDDRGARVAGDASLSNDERDWIFTPSGHWRAEPHTLVIDARIEDLAGNTLVRPFDVDLRLKLSPRRDAVRLSFHPIDR